MRPATDADLQAAIAAEILGQPQPAERIDELLLLTGFAAGAFDRLVLSARALMRQREVAALEWQKRVLTARVHDLNQPPPMPEDWL